MGGRYGVEIEHHRIDHPVLASSPPPRLEPPGTTRDGPPGTSGGRLFVRPASTPVPAPAARKPPPKPPASRPPRRWNRITTSSRASYAICSAAGPESPGTPRARGTMKTQEAFCVRWGGAGTRVTRLGPTGAEGTCRCDKPFHATPCQGCGGFRIDGSFGIPAYGSRRSRRPCAAGTAVTPIRCAVPARSRQPSTRSSPPPAVGWDSGSPEQPHVLVTHAVVTEPDLCGVSTLVAWLQRAHRGGTHPGVIISS